MTEPIMAFDMEVRTNSELIQNAARLGYVKGRTLDPTWGKGNFWTTVPESVTELVKHGLDVDGKGHYDDGVNFRYLPYGRDEFDTVVFDPPYKLNGKAGSHPLDAAFGVATSMRWQDRMTECRAGLSECVRVLRPGGHLLMKCMDQVVSGRVVWQTFDFTEAAKASDCHLVDSLHLRSYRPQPAGRAQQHARRNYSTLLVFRKAP